jgi:hypothetical protein
VFLFRSGLENLPNSGIHNHQNDEPNSASILLHLRLWIPGSRPVGRAPE